MAADETAGPEEQLLWVEPPSAHVPGTSRPREDAARTWRCFRGPAASEAMGSSLDARGWHERELQVALWRHADEVVYDIQELSARSARQKMEALLPPFAPEAHPVPPIASGAIDCYEPAESVPGALSEERTDARLGEGSHAKGWRIFAKDGNGHFWYRIGTHRFSNRSDALRFDANPASYAPTDSGAKSAKGGPAAAAAPANPSRAVAAEQPSKKQLARPIRIRDRLTPRQPPESSSRRGGRVVPVRRGSSKVEEEEDECDADEFEVEAILERRTRMGRSEYLCSWVGYDDQTWEPSENLHPELVADFERALAAEEYEVEAIVQSRHVGDQMFYLIRWVGYDDQTWEPCDSLHPELVAEYESRIQTVEEGAQEPAAGAPAAEDAAEEEGGEEEFSATDMSCTDLDDSSEEEGDGLSLVARALR